MVVLKLGKRLLEQPEHVMKIVGAVKHYHKKYGKVIVVTSGIWPLSQSVWEVTSARPGDTDVAKLGEKVRSIINSFYFSFTRPSWERVEEYVRKIENKLKGLSYIGESFPELDRSLNSCVELISSYLLYDLLCDFGINCKYLDTWEFTCDDESLSVEGMINEKNRNYLRGVFSGTCYCGVISGGLAISKQGEIVDSGKKGIGLTSVAVAILSGAKDIVHLAGDEINSFFPASGKVVKLDYEEAIEYFSFCRDAFSKEELLAGREWGINFYLVGRKKVDCPVCIVSNKGKDSESGRIKSVFPLRDILHILVELEKPSGVDIEGLLKSDRIEKKFGIRIYWFSSNPEKRQFEFALGGSGYQRFLDYIEEALGVSSIKIYEDLSIVVVFGNLAEKLDRVFSYLAREFRRSGVVVKDVVKNVSGKSIMFIVSRENEQKVVRIIENMPEVEGTKIGNVFVAGTGKVGRALLSILKNRKLKEGIEIRVVGIANSRKMYFDENGVDIEKWEEILFQKGVKSDLTKFREVVESSVLPNKIFVDCTPSREVAILYPKFVKKGVSVVTANKIMNTEKYELYELMQKVSSNGYCRYFYETTVGAGLPVISSIRSLVDSGDEVLKIEAILSGTLSFIVNQVNKGMLLSEAVYKAWILGYTEPDIRNDLDGLDTARKLLILAREAGKTLELKDIKLTPLIPKEYFEVNSNEELIERLKGYDLLFRERVERAKEHGRKVVYLAELSEEEASVGLREVNEESPFFHLEGSDNLVLIRTTRYKDNPLIIRGPGAGPEVTAGGLVKDIVKFVDMQDY